MDDETVEVGDITPSTCYSNNSAPHVYIEIFMRDSFVPRCFWTSLTSIAGVNKATVQNGADNPRGLARIASAEHSPVG